MRKHKHAKPHGFINSRLCVPALKAFIHLLTRINTPVSTAPPEQEMQITRKGLGLHLHSLSMKLTVVLYQSGSPVELQSLSGFTPQFLPWRRILPLRQGCHFLYESLFQREVIRGDVRWWNEGVEGEESNFKLLSEWIIKKFCCFSGGVSNGEPHAGVSILRLLVPDVKERQC